MGKKLAIFIMFIGLACLIYGGWQLFLTSSLQKQSLTEAREITGEQVSSPEDFQATMGDVIGILEITKLEAELPIVSGTDEDELDRGVGHYTSTVLPGQNDQILLSGHRDTVFRDMGKLEIGDDLTVHMPYGSYTYRIVDTEIVDANDTSVIRSTAPDEVLTLSTCYPFNFIGSAPERYIIYAEPYNQ
ncbi:class D sortase [Halalkalibacterium halodurans]|uniref:Sortase n=1 Tax=Halalkalibacterium halodurans TaxID=86665 RepID=A0A0M0KFW9_ALKHA|nr:class D sortase [Halalkalibacterium halodurans]MED4081908.1 class D sortase [Halalkalibacterium halodurans]MED4083711.1 class D sortase [Halalkalibacterium halodurans]MED4106387.1 class D sortase [Halalkalibacterium halodurans]MED4107798.1 class D sortase [Halalkalibacterium halodurans]MED4126295.1 class D sortase [Halalkalibacterium halodurans]